MNTGMWSFQWVTTECRMSLEFRSESESLRTSRTFEFEISGVSVVNPVPMFPQGFPSKRSEVTVRFRAGISFPIRQRTMCGNMEF